MKDRKHFIDWIRVIAIVLLLVYHVAIAFQPWGLMIGFIVNTEPWVTLWIPMTMLNIWRIPILFFIAGIGVFYSFQNRNWHQLLKERALRIGIPFAIGFVFIAPFLLYCKIIMNGNFNTFFSPLVFGKYLCYILPLLHYIIWRQSNSLFALKLENYLASDVFNSNCLLCYRNN